jgi:hypothetical protein
MKVSYKNSVNRASLCKSFPLYRGSLFKTGPFLFPFIKFQVYCHWFIKAKLSAFTIKTGNGKRVLMKLYIDINGYLRKF